MGDETLPASTGIVPIHRAALAFCAVNMLLTRDTVTTHRISTSSLLYSTSFTGNFFVLSKERQEGLILPARQLIFTVQV
ncbi:MAG: hypothetical protein EA344_00550 [Alkalicoccus sp.]|nr:MAG: hypothetical protein EA344_00550 [Alkalicoccus sp.]